MGRTDVHLMERRGIKPNASLELKASSKRIRSVERDLLAAGGVSVNVKKKLMHSCQGETSVSGGKHQIPGRKLTKGFANTKELP